ncbi:heat shock 70 kDa protein 12B-like [Mercenaria mercenaria]|uniref:heat shock 70 kDa protein 12B-like n=1 Tax=Mercenaria mercenaria TaxID=6596 RepID=UPI00234EA350|nr:heat shock 70 kDa protein 12B-like [Mercenaria mercenaria]
MMAADLTEFKPNLVVSIDFGTSGSGFAFQMRKDYEQSKTSNIYDNNDWGQAVRRIKTSTCLLIKPDLQCKENTVAYFGENAENEYIGLEGDLEEWYFFRHFKMQLYEKQTIHSNMMIRGDKGKELPAYYVFGQSIRCIKQNVLTYIGQWNEAYLNETIKWVITVPAIWSEGAKQIMRKAAEEAGIPHELTSIALEPEAAGIYCAESDAKLSEELNNGKPYVIVDMGGGTVDITTLLVAEKGKFIQLQPASGCDAGGEMVNAKMYELISDIFGEEIWRFFSDEQSFCFVEFRRSVEAAKLSITANKTDPKKDFFYLNLSAEILSAFAEGKGCSITQAIRLSGNKRIEVKKGRLKVESDVLREIMDETIQKVKSHVIQEIDDLQKIGHEICTVVLVGGFASSKFAFEKIKEYVQKEKPRIDVRRPPYSNIAVMNGAVMYGQDESILVSRSLQMTYGIRATRLYNKDFPAERKVEINGKAYVKNIFSVHAHRGQDVKRDEWISHTGYFPVTGDQKKAVLQLVASKEKYPKYTDEEGCFDIGHYTIEFSADKFQHNCTDISFSFGTTEMKIRARNTTTKYEIIERVVLTESSI